MGIKQPLKNVGKIMPTTDKFPPTSFNYPVFCLKHLHRDYSLTDCTNDEKIHFINRLVKLSSMTWEQIRLAQRHGLGQEKISQDSIKPSKPPHVTKDVTFYALRFDGLKPFVGYKTDFIFHVIYIDRNFTVYEH